MQHLSILHLAALELLTTFPTFHTFSYVLTCILFIILPITTINFFIVFELCADWKTIIIMGDLMIFIYNCYAGTHSSSLASAVHLKKLPIDRVPTKEEIIKTDYFDKLKSKDMGRIIFRGIDDEGNKVFTMGRGSSKLIITCLVNMLNLLCNDYGFKEKIIFSNMSPSVPLFMTIGGFLSRRFGLQFMGTPLLVIGAKQAHKKIIGFVNNTRESAKTFNEHVLVLANEKSSS